MRKNLSRSSLERELSATVVSNSVKTTSCLADLVAPDGVPEVFGPRPMLA